MIAQSLVNKLPQVIEGKFVARLILAVLITVLLNGIVGEVDVFVLQVFAAEGLAGRPHIALIVPVGPEFPIHNCHHCVAAHVELPLVIQHRR